MQAFLAILCIGGTPASDVPTPDRLRAAVRRWGDEVSFRCTFRLRSGVACSMEQGRRGELDPNLGSPYTRWEARGELAKLGTKMRCRVDYGSPGVRYGPRAADVTLEPVEEATDGTIGVRRFLRRNELFGDGASVASVEAWRIERGMTRAAGQMTGQEALPLTPMRSGAEQPFESLEITDVRPIDKEHVEVLCGGREEGRRKRIDFRGTRNRRIVFWVTPTPPVVTRIDEVAERAAADEPTRVVGRDERCAILSDFKPCPGGLVAKHVVYVEQYEGLRARDFKFEEPGVRVVEWRSEDLGERAPADADFVMAIPSDVRVIGLRQDLPPGTERSVDPSKIGVSDLEERDEATPAPTKPLLHTGLGSLLLAWGFTAVSLGILSAWRLVRRHASGPGEKTDNG